jgi:hypothetical protein
MKRRLMRRDYAQKLLAREARMPIETVHEIYNIEHARLDQIARIKTYVPVLIRRHVREVLRTRQVAS